MGTVCTQYMFLFCFLLPFCGEIKLCISPLFCLSVTVVNNNEPCTLHSLIVGLVGSISAAANHRPRLQLEGKYSLESTDPHESEIRAPPQMTIALKLSYLFIVAKLFKVKVGCLKFVYIGKKSQVYGVFGQ